jgi:hypothetical protein
MGTLERSVIRVRDKSAFAFSTVPFKASKTRPQPIADSDAARPYANKSQLPVGINARTYQRWASKTYIHYNGAYNENCAFELCL